MKKMTFNRMLVIGTVAISAAGCTSSPKLAYEDAKAQIGHQKAGFKSLRDPEQLLSYAAQNAKTPDEVVRYNRAYGKLALDHGKSQEAYAAYERAALAGDASAGRRLVKGQLDGVYQPENVSMIAKSVYLPLTADKSDANTRLLLAQLVDQGKIGGAESRTVDLWLNEAAAAGATKAFRQLAERAEKSGNVALASDYYYRAEKTSKADRALRQARVQYLGLEGGPNPKLGHAWLELARKLDKQGAGQLAARVYRTTSGATDGAYLISVATAAGVDVLSREQLLEAYRGAKTDLDRAKILEPLKAAARKNDPNASFELAAIYISTRGEPSEINNLLVESYSKGKPEALDLMISQLMRAEAGQGAANILFDGVVKAAQKGNVEAARSLSSLYRIGGFKAADRAESLKWLQQAADAGDAKSQYELGVDLYENGGNQQSKQMALQYLNKAAGQGDLFALTYLKSKT
ncbi:TPR repeat protein [Rhizobium aethiopicum]|uniref:TPR repeat protein n=1 Tax=Rhizobium aethiopicum TaxID=1138170 RepID=A0A7W6MJ40_9HYPH|nr:sel1 repeat family protein [Rhizobium aethiopicum]MBB4193048.1 TPR repeat protein [Rhizobium aethiopicum]MBB4579309.1 TPR repeat protein [Rhizobium aethiopicum]